MLFLQGGASLQFAMLPRTCGRKAPPPTTSSRALVESRARRGPEAGPGARRGSSEPTSFDRVPGQAELDLDPAAAYLHYTSNKTIYGTQWSAAPEPPTGVPLVCDASSDALSRPFDAARTAVLYAGAQKNLGPSGVTIVVVRRDLLERVPRGLPALLDYKLLAENKSLYNTPPTFAIYVVGLVLSGCSRRAASRRWASATGRRPRSSTAPSTAATASTAGTRSRAAAR